jgi:hypothetical protein
VSLRRGEDKVRKMVQVALRGLGVEPDKAGFGEGAWVVTKGTASVVVRIVEQADETKPAHLQVTSPVMRLPANVAIKDRLLDYNFRMGGLAAFCITPAGVVQLTSARAVDGISPEEIARLIAQVAHFSDLFDDELLDAFGRELALEAPRPRPAPAEPKAEPKAAKKKA